MYFGKLRFLKKVCKILIKIDKNQFDSSPVTIGGVPEGYEGVLLNDLVLLDQPLNEKNDIYNKCIKYWRHTNNIGIMTYKMETLITPRLSCLDKLYLFLNQKYYNKIDFKLKMFLN